MIDYEEVLSNEQQDICFSNKNLLVKACPRKWENSDNYI